MEREETREQAYVKGSGQQNREKNQTTTYGSDCEGPVPSHNRIYPLGVSRLRSSSGIAMMEVTTAVMSPEVDTSR